LLCHEGAKQDTIGVTRRTRTKLPHFMGHALIYIMKNEMSLIHHAIDWWGCDYTNEDDKGLSEKTRGHPMLKPKSKPMEAKAGVRESIKPR